MSCTIFLCHPWHLRLLWVLKFLAFFDWRLLFESYVPLELTELPADSILMALVRRQVLKRAASTLDDTKLLTPLLSQVLGYMEVVGHSLYSSRVIEHFLTVHLHTCQRCVTGIVSQPSQLPRVARDALWLVPDSLLKCFLELGALFDFLF